MPDINFSIGIPVAPLSMLVLHVSSIGLMFAFFMLSGFSISFWAIVALVRYVSDHAGSRRQQVTGITQASITQAEVAAIIPAHNEEMAIAHALEGLKRILPANQIYVGSDASTDRTVEIVESLGCQVVDIQPNRGKAGVLAYLLEHFRLCERYKAVLIVDADTELDANYLRNALPFFNDPDVVAMAGHAVTRWRRHAFPQWSMFFVSYRVRLYRVLQAIMRYSQTWKYTNVTIIVPGFASMYRSHALKQIDITAPGLIIEDFNMTFELHHKRLGKVAYHPSVFGVCLDPFTLHDYARQVKRWSLGFWQTIRRHGIWPSFFWLALGVYQIEMIMTSIFTLAVPVLLIGFFFSSFEPILITFPDLLPFEFRVTFADLFVGIFVTDYLLTALVAFIEKKPMLLVYGLGFMLLRLIDAFVYLYAFPLAFFTQSTGTWTSPTRRAIQ